MTAEATSKEAEYKHRGLNFMSASTLHAIAFAATHDLYGSHSAAHSSSELHLGYTYEYERFRVAQWTTRRAAPLSRRPRHLRRTRD
jgi:hypothetical protein